MIWCPSEEAAWSMKSLEYEKPGLWCEKQIIAVWPQQPGVAHALPHSWGQFYSFWYKYVRVNILQYTNTTHYCFACTPLQFRGHFFHCVCRNTNIIQKKTYQKNSTKPFWKCSSMLEILSVASTRRSAFLRQCSKKGIFWKIYNFELQDLQMLTSCFVAGMFLTDRFLELLEPQGWNCLGEFWVEIFFGC